MDHCAFDTFAQLVASRRVALRSGAAVLLGTSHSEEQAQAKCKTVGAKCNQSKCCAGARCKRGRCRCKSSHPLWADTCCKDRFVDKILGQKVEEGTPLCCAPKSVCPQSGNPYEDDCCAAGAACVGGQCCCDGCKGTVTCGGTCCAAASCCNGVCCGGDQVCAVNATATQACVSATRNCATNAQCFPGETCWGGVCCTAGRMCSENVGPGPDLEVCCSASQYCDAANTCCPIGGDCSTGKKVRIRV